jgi:hypothetical protein
MADALGVSAILIISLPSPNLGEIRLSTFKNLPPPLVMTIIAPKATAAPAAKPHNFAFSSVSSLLRLF